MHYLWRGLQLLKSDVLVVGSGVGGATVARELAIRGRKITIVENGLKC